MATLPQEMIFNILSWLPVKALLRFRCVCKSWQTLISDPYFITTHYDRSKDTQKLSFIVNNYGPYLHRLYFPNRFGADLNSVSIDVHSHFKGSPVTLRHLVGSCDGLVCFLDHILGVCVLNPFTGELKKSPQFQRSSDLGHFYSSIWGFGSSSKTQGFKVLKIDYFRSNWHSSDKQARVFVQTVSSSPNSNSWRTIAEPIDYYIYSDTQIVVDGNPHWRGTYLNGSVIYLKIVSFDVAEERFQELPYPEFEDERYSMEFLGVLRGCLCVFRCFYSGLVEVWVMEEYGIKESWKRRFSFTEPKLGDLTRIRQRHLSFLPNSEVLVVAYGEKIVLYDPCNGCFQEFVVSNAGFGSQFEVLACTENLVSLKGKNASRLRIESI